MLIYRVFLCSIGTQLHYMISSIRRRVGWAAQENAQDRFDFLIFRSKGLGWAAQLSWVLGSWATQLKKSNFAHWVKIPDS